MDEQSTSTQPSQSKESEKSHKTLWIILGVLAVVIFGGIMYVFGVNNSTTEAVRNIFITAPKPTQTPPADVYEPTPTVAPTTEVEPTEEIEPTEEVEPTETIEPTDEPEVTPAT